MPSDLEVVGRLDGRRAALVVEHRQLAEDVSRPERGERDLAAVRVLADGARVPGADDVTGVRVVTLAEHELAGAEAPRHRDFGDAAQVLVRELLEHGHAAQQRGRLLSARGHDRPQHVTGLRAAVRPCQAPARGAGA